MFSVIFWTPKYWNSSQANFSIISKYRNSSKANFDIIPKYRNSSQANFDIIPKYRNSSKANFGFSEIGNALSNHLLSAHTHIHVQYSTLYTKRVCIASHSAQRVANRFRNNMSMTLYQAFSPIAQIHYSQCGAEVASTVIDILLRNLFATRCALWAAMHILYCT